jgi:hypothetical protein
MAQIQSRFASFFVRASNKILLAALLPTCRTSVLPASVRLAIGILLDALTILIVSIGSVAMFGGRLERPGAQIWCIQFFRLMR